MATAPGGTPRRSGIAVDGTVAPWISRRAVPWLLLLSIMLAGALLRFPGLGEAPPGLYHDEAYNALDALDVLRGARPLYFAANNGREPFYIYLVAAAVGLFGREPWAERLPSALLGTLTIPAAYAMARAWFPGRRRVALITAALTAFTFWPLHLSRIGFRAVSLPLLAALALAALGAWLNRRAQAPGLKPTPPLAWAALAGALVGASLYTYIASRLVPVALVLFALWAWRAGWLQVTWRQLAAFVLAAALVAAPLGVYAALYPDVVFARVEQASILNPAVSGGDPAGALLRHTLLGLGMFVWQGDGIARHNLPGRPVFDALMSAFFLAGAVWCFARARREPGAALALIWSAVMLVPTILAEDTPHFLRAVGVLPVVLLLPALGLDAAARRLEARRVRLAVLLAPVVLALSALLTLSAYARYAGSFKVYTEFETAAVALAREARAFPGDVYVARRFWDNYQSVQFMLADHPRVHLIDRPQDVAPAGDALVLAWPHDPDDAPQGYMARLPAGHVLAARMGPEAQGDLEQQAYPLYVALSAQGAPPAPAQPVARFAGGIVLREARVVPGGDSVDVQLLWEASAALPADYTVYVHVLRDGQPLSSGDGPPALNTWPTGAWRPGDLVRDDHAVALKSQPYDPAHMRVRVGLYGADGKRVPVMDQQGNMVDDGVTLGNPLTR